MKTYQNLLDAARTRVPAISASDALQKWRPDGSCVFLDVRDSVEYRLGKIPHAITISRGTLEERVESLVSRDRDVIVYCANGPRSILAASALQGMGYERIHWLEEGFNGWIGVGGEVD